MRHPRLWFVIALTVVATSTYARAGATSEIRAVDVSSNAETTRIRLRAAKALSFSVYKLEKPSRVVVDLSRARLAESLAAHDMLTPNTWGVSTVSVQQVEDAGNVVRVSVTLARPGSYDVKSD